jgi:hypothetical protein
VVAIVSAIIHILAFALALALSLDIVIFTVPRGFGSTMKRCHSRATPCAGPCGGCCAMHTGVCLIHKLQGGGGGGGSGVDFGFLDIVIVILDVDDLIRVV